MILRQAYLQTLFAQADRKIAAAPEGPEREKMKQEFTTELKKVSEQLGPKELKNE